MVPRGYGCNICFFSIFGLNSQVEFNSERQGHETTVSYCVHLSFLGSLSGGVGILYHSRKLCAHPVLAGLAACGSVGLYP